MSEQAEQQRQDVSRVVVVVDNQNAPRWAVRCASDAARPLLVRESAGLANDSPARCLFRSGSPTRPPASDHARREIADLIESRIIVQTVRRQLLCPERLRRID
jgi:hypothetical protein